MLRVLECDRGDTPCAGMLLVSCSRWVRRSPPRLTLRRRNPIRSTRASGSRCLINFAAGGPADIEGRLFARHFGKHIDGAPNIIVQNRDGAGGLIGTNYLGELGPRDGTMAGYLTAAAWNYVIDPGSYRVDFQHL